MSTRASRVDEEQPTAAASVTSVTSVSVASASWKDFVAPTKTYLDLNVNFVKLYKGLEDKSVSEHEHAFCMKQLLTFFDQKEAEHSLVRANDEQSTAASITSNTSERSLSSISGMASAKSNHKTIVDPLLSLNQVLSGLSPSKVPPQVETSNDDIDDLDLFGDSTTPTDRETINECGLMDELEMGRSVERGRSKLDPSEYSTPHSTPTQDNSIMSVTAKNREILKRKQELPSPPLDRKKKDTRKSLTQRVTDATRNIIKPKGQKGLKK